MSATALLTIFGVLSIAIFLPDLFRNSHFLQNHISYSSGIISTVIIVVTLLIRIFIKDNQIAGWIKKLLFLIFVITFATSILFSYLNYSLYPNYIFSHLLLNTNILALISLASGVVWLIYQSNSFFKKNYSMLLVVIPLVFTLFCMSMFLWPLNGMSDITREDGLVENSQFIVLLVGMIAAFSVTRKTFSKHRNVAFIYILLALSLFFVAGDEISWGQRIFHFKTSESMQLINTQKETTIHNIYSISKIVPIGYILIGLYGSIISLIVRGKKIASPLVLKYFFPNNNYFVIYFMPFLFNGYTILFKHNLGNFSEPAELLLYSGITFFMLELAIMKNLKKN